MRQRGLHEAQTGDLCLLLAPTYSQSPVIRIQLADLQRQFGGEIVAPLHVTCQRFRASDTQLAALKPRLEAFAKTAEPIHVCGERLEPFYSTFRAQEILKCHLEPNPTLDHFRAALAQRLEAVGIAQQNAEPDPVTMLEGITINHLNTFGFRRKLFIGQRLLLTRTRSPGHYETLFSTAIANTKEAELALSDLA